MNIVNAALDTQQKIVDLKEQIEINYNQFHQGEQDFKKYQERENNLLSTLEKLLIVKNTQGIV